MQRELKVRQSFSRLKRGIRLLVIAASMFGTNILLSKAEQHFKGVSLSFSQISTFLKYAYLLLPSQGIGSIATSLEYSAPSWPIQRIPNIIGKIVESIPNKHFIYSSAVEAKHLYRNVLVKIRPPCLTNGRTVSTRLGRAI